MARMASDVLEIQTSLPKCARIAYPRTSDHHFYAIGDV